MHLVLVEKHQEVYDILNRHGTFSPVHELLNWLLLKIESKALWVELKAHARVVPVPPLWTSIDRLPAGIQARVGTIAPDAKTVGDVLRDLTGDEDFGQE